jgi:hypothetical protein
MSPITEAEIASHRSGGSAFSTRLTISSVNRAVFA